MSDSLDPLWVVLVAAPALMSKEDGYHMPPQSHRETLRGFVERTEGDLDNAIVLARGWWNEGLTTDGEAFLDSLEREFGVSALPSQEIQEVVNDAFSACDGWRPARGSHRSCYKSPGRGGERRIFSSGMQGYRKCGTGRCSDGRDQRIATRYRTRYRARA
jgi:hypothetical protein